MKKIWKKLAKGAVIAGSAVGAHIAVNGYLSNQGQFLTSPLPGKQMLYDWRLGKIWYTAAGSGPPVLLVHGIGAGASSYEWRHNVGPLSEKFQVFALDLLGFGLSDRPVMNHSGRYYVQLIDDFIKGVIGAPTNVIASSHSAAYAIRLAHTRPERIHTITAICPMGPDTSAKPSAALEWSARILGLPFFGDTAYHLLTSRAGIARTLREDLYYDAGLVDDAMIDHYYASAHRPGARSAIASFLRGDMDLGIREELASIKQPVLIPWGAESIYSPASNARAYQELNGRAIVQMFQGARQLPHDEKADEFNRLVTSWLLPATADQALRVLS